MTTVTVLAGFHRRLPAAGARLLPGLLVQFPANRAVFYNGSYKTAFSAIIRIMRLMATMACQNDGRKQSINITGNYFYSPNRIWTGWRCGRNFAKPVVWRLKCVRVLRESELNGYDDRLQLFGAFVNYNRSGSVVSGCVGDWAYGLAQR